MPTPRKYAIPMNKQVRISVPDDQKAWLEQQASVSGVSIPDVIRNLIAKEMYPNYETHRCKCVVIPNENQ